MDRIFKSDEQAFISPIISVKGFYEKAIDAWNDISDLLALNNNKATEEMDADDETIIVNHEDDANELAIARRFAEFAQVSSGVARELSSICSIQALKSDETFEVDDEDPFSTAIPPDVPLATLEIQKRELEKRSNSTQYKSLAQRNLKYDRVDFKALRDIEQPTGNEPKNQQYYTPDDVMLTVEFMRPYNRPLAHHEIRLGRLLKLDACYLVCGSLRLTQLRDRIQCPSDFATSFDCSDDPKAAAKPDEFSKDNSPSNMFFINDTFYIDQRNPDAHDLSIPIREWAKRRSNEIGPLHVADMESTTFFDLNLRLGQPYLYVHQGACEHLMVFCDLRLMNAADKQDMSLYPISILHKFQMRTVCCVCKIYTAKWVTYGNRRLPIDPGFFCERCFRGFNYRSNGTKIGEFSAVPFFDRTALS